MVQPSDTEPDIELCKASIMPCHRAQREPYTRESVLLTKDYLKAIPLPSSFSKIWRLLASSPPPDHLQVPARRPSTSASMNAQKNISVSLCHAFTSISA